MVEEEVGLAALSSQHRPRHRHHHLPPSIPSIKDFMKQLASNHSCLMEKISEFHALFLPSTLSQPLVAAHQSLSELLHLYISCNDNNSFNRLTHSGLLMAFDPDSLRIPPFGIVVDDMPAFSVRFQCRVLLFSPSIGNMLEVEVRDVRSDHLVCIAHGIFNVLVLHQSPLSPDERISQRSKRKRKQRDSQGTPDLTSNSLLALTDEFSAASVPPAHHSVALPALATANSSDTLVEMWGVSVGDRVLVRVTEVDLSAQPIPHIAAVIN